MQLWTGHITIGPLTIYGENAMNWSADCKLFGKYLCFSLPTWRRIIGRDHWKIYYSLDGTPGKADWGLSSSKEEFGSSK